MKYINQTNIKWQKYLSIFAYSLILVLPAHQAVSKPTHSSTQCTAPANWFTGDPGIPSEVPNNGDTFCDFYHFTWQSFISLMSTYKSTPTSPENNAQNRNFSNTQDYPVYELNTDGTPANSCDGQISGITLKNALAKGDSFIHGEAGGGDVIFDQAGNIAYYDMRFSRNMCDDAQSIKDSTNFPGGTTELKTAWKVLTQSDNTADYLVWKNPIGTPNNTTLGLIGFHFAIATPDHPEFIWATFEHNKNAPDCDKPSTNKGWSFISESCSTALQTGNNKSIAKCLNQAKPNDELTGVPTEICRVYPYGTDSSDSNAKENVSDIVAMNQSVHSQLDGAMSVFKNYFNVGAIWVHDINDDSSVNGDVTNQRGSLRLANTVAETTFQWVDTNPKTNGGFASNCFGCHSYAGEKTNKNKNTTSGQLSHIFNNIVVGTGSCVDVQAGPIESQQGAVKKCSSNAQPKGVCPNLGLTWNGQWTTTKDGEMSVCGCCQ
ncbi:hypothetical protein PSECIP111854_00198 [Pseudoalteromonas sp. CIP111854]|uniref:Mannan-binding protein domain-containing protein n=1 Tax=Pseudoalteromonas holothuriae TaxID=2963714 RepID=A0A9W4VLF4_9GAMM|nr:mannan-binding lectin [Pseudoalteromonas sp. CIP111854]CAH9049556.1 hypothetical protein PSECIP111854_00198 [Pseudoalteromonas sp. CIP111854]